MVDHLFASMALGASAVLGGIFGGFGGGHVQPLGATSTDGDGPGHAVVRHLGDVDTSGGYSSGGFQRAPGGTASTTDAVVMCVKNAVAAREADIDAADATQAATRSAALSTRAASLASAYTGTDTKTIRTAVQAAWSLFNKSVANAQKTFQASQKTAMSTFQTAIKACNAPRSILVAQDGAGMMMGGGDGSSDNKPQGGRPMTQGSDGSAGNGGGGGNFGPTGAPQQNTGGGDGGAGQ